jgi:RNA polymerase sigma-B factor
MISTIQSIDAARSTSDLDAVRRRRDQRQRDRHLLRHLPLAFALARRYAPAYGSEQELIPVARLGLVRAVERYDPQSGTPFATFAEQLIVAELEDHIDDRSREAPQRRTRARAAEAEQARGSLAEAVGRQERIHDLASFLGCDVGPLIDGLMRGVEKDPHLIPSPGARLQPSPPFLRAV